MKNTIIILFLILSFLMGCNSKDKNTSDTIMGNSITKTGDKNLKDTTLIKNASIDDLKMILARKEIPILCYHHIREAKIGDYTVSPENFKQEMKLLADSGYKTILPNQLYNYLTHGSSIPKKSVMITFDDTDLEQFTIGKSEMDKYGFKGVYFIMTISIGKPRYMNKQQIKQLSEEGHAIECHTWDHHRVDRYIASDWETQLVKPRKTLEDIINNQIHYFAYPFGVWNRNAIPELKKRGYKLAFILSTKRDTTEPLYTIRRMIVAGQWSPAGMMKAMAGTFR